MGAVYSGRQRLSGRSDVASGLAGGRGCVWARGLSPCVCVSPPADPRDGRAGALVLPVPVPVPVRRPRPLSPTSTLLAAHVPACRDLDRAAVLLPPEHRAFQAALSQPRDLRVLVAGRFAHGSSDAARFVAWLEELALRAESLSLGAPCAAAASSSSSSWTLSGAEATHGIAAVVDDLIKTLLPSLVSVASGAAESSI